MFKLALAAALALSLPASAADPTTDRAVDDVLARIGAAFDKGDGQAVADNWTEDGTLINPLGVIAVGRTTVERLATIDAATMLKGTKSVFTRERLRAVSDSAVLVDASHTATGATQVSLHVTFLMVKAQGVWRVADARPYAFLMPQPTGSVAKR
jgi:uncharacterized protein (TIGR02246 family)